MHQEDFEPAGQSPLGGAPYEEFVGGHTPVTLLQMDQLPPKQEIDETVGSAAGEAPPTPPPAPTGNPSSPSPEEARKSPDENAKNYQNPQILFAWKAPLRPYIKRSPKITRFYIALSLLLSLLVVFFGDWVLLLPIWTVLFLFYVLTITPPPEVEHKINRFGIDAAGLKIRWGDLSHFHFDKRFGYDMLTVVSQPPYLDHFYMVVPSEEVKKRLIVILSPHLVYEEEPKRTFVDRMVHAMSRLVPQEEQSLH